MTEDKPVHSELGASQFERWSACPGSVALSRGLPGTSSPYAAEGTAAHEVAAFCLSHDASPYEQVGNTLQVEGFSIEVTEEMADAIALYLRVIQADYAEDPERPTRLVEHRFHLKTVHENAYGTADCAQHWAEKKLLRVYDYKYGAGVPVDVTDNGQLKYYGLGSLLESGLPVDEIELVIVQPRCKHPDGPVRRFRLTALDMLEFAGDLSEAIEATEDPMAPLGAGEHCRWCKAAAICPELAKRATAAAKMDFRPEIKYDPALLAENLRWLPILEGWAKSVREFAYAEANRGNAVPGFKLVDKRANRKWRQDDHTTEIELGKLGFTESDIFKPREIVGPAVIDKLIGKAKKNADKQKALELLVKKESSGTTLVPDTDVREPHKHSAVADFADV